MSAGRPGPGLVVGLTGGIGSGKTTAARHFEALGVPVLDADAVAREVVEPGEEGLAEVVDAFGSGVVDDAGRLDRAALRARVFAEPDERERLEAILHPKIRERLRAALAGIEAPYAIVEIPLLIESGQGDLVDRVLVVETAEETRIERTTRRDGTDRDDARRIVAAQAPSAARLAAADDLIHNDGPAEALLASVERLHRRYLLLARLPQGPDQ